MPERLIQFINRSSGYALLEFNLPLKKETIAPNKPGSAVSSPLCNHGEVFFPPLVSIVLSFPLNPRSTHTHTSESISTLKLSSNWENYTVGKGNDRAPIVRGGIYI